MNNKKCISCSVNDPTEFVLTRFALGVMKHLGGKNFVELPDGSAHYCRKTLNQYIKSLKYLLKDHQGDQELKNYLTKEIIAKRRSLN